MHTLDTITDLPTNFGITNSSLKTLRLNNPKNVIFSYLNINSIRNKMGSLREVVMENVDILAITKTKIDESFPTAQFLLVGYHSPYRLDKSPKSGGILVYVKSSIPSRQLNFPNLPYKIQAIPFELNLRKEKWLVISIYRPPLESLSCFLDSLTNMIDFFSSSYDNFIVMGDFNSQPTDSIMKDFMDANGFINLIKSNTCFKGKGSCIDLILTNRKYSFKHSNSVETGISDHHHLIYTMLKTTFSKAEPKLVHYREYK